MKARHGLVIGKFYPPHAGHHLLVRAASACSDRVTVVVMAADAESIPLTRRVQWMQEVHGGDGNVTVVGTVDNLRVDYEDDDVWRGHVALMREAASSVTAEPVDAVFTSEAYGDELGRRLGARHALVDSVRELVPISGTAVRADPVAAWSLLAPCVRGYLVRRVVLVGAESTGKTTLAALLTDRLRQRGGALGLTRSVSEYGRDFTVEKLAIARARAALLGERRPALEALSWETQDFVQIAREQSRREQEAARLGGPVLVCDTDAFATSVWHERYLGARDGRVDALADGHSDALYLLTHPDDVPFVQDGLRDGESIRRWMTTELARRLTQDGRRWAWVRGDTNDQRLGRALFEIDAVLARGWELAPPSG